MLFCIGKKTLFVIEKPLQFLEMTLHKALYTSRQTDLWEILVFLVVVAVAYDLVDAQV